MQTALRILKLGVGIALLVFLVTKADIYQISHLIGSSNRWYILIAILVYVFTVVVISLRWKLLLTVNGMDVPLQKLASFYLVGLFVNNFLPTSIGGDVVRVLDLARENGRKTESLASVVVERLVGLLALVLLVLVASLLVVGEESNPYILALDGVLLGFLGVLAIFFFYHKASEALEGWFSRFPLFRPGMKLSNLYGSVRIYQGSKGVLLAVLGLSALYQGMMMTLAYAVNLALGLGIPFAYFVLFVPVVAIVSMIPVSINALGVREGGFVYLFSTIGRSPSEALSLSLMIYVLGVLVSLPGGLLFMVRKEKPLWRRAELSSGLIQVVKSRSPVSYEAET